MSEDTLLTRLRPQRPRRLAAAERRMEIWVATLFGVTAVVLALVLHSDRSPAVLDVVALVLVHAACSRIRLYVGTGFGMPTQLVIVPMLFILPAGTVPLAVGLGLVLAGAIDVVRGTRHPEWLLAEVGDAWHAVGPALVIAAAGEPSAVAAHWWVLVPVLGAEFVFDLVSSSAREWLSRGTPPQLQLRVIAWVYSIDVLLTPVAFVALLAPVADLHGWLIVAPLAAVLAVLANDRRRHVEEIVAGVDALGRERERLQNVLRRVGQALAANLDREAMLAAILRTATEALDAEAGLAGPPGTATTTSIGSPAAAVLEAAAAGAVAEERTVMYDADDWHVLAGPLRQGAETLAVARRSRPFSAEEAEIFDHLAVHAAVSIENAELHERVREQAVVDELTGLANHRALQAHLRAQMEVSDTELALIMVDIDDFKRVNDTYGHQQGDRVLRVVADTIRARCRAVDFPARYGGEELAIALSRTDVAGARLVAEELRAAIAALAVPMAGGETLTLTISVGVAAASETVTNPSRLVALADAALYRAKRTGKNRVVTAGSDAGQQRSSRSEPGRPPSRPSRRRS